MILQILVPFISLALVASVLESRLAAIEAVAVNGGPGDDPEREPLPSEFNNIIAIGRLAA